MKRRARPPLVSLALLPALAIAWAGLAHAADEGPCGASVTVEVGDTLTEIARRCAVSPQALMEANPVIRDPDIVPLGARLTIPGGREASKAPQPPADVPGLAPVAVMPERAAPGTRVVVHARNLAPGADVLIGGGIQPHLPIFFARARIDEAGILAAEIELPEWAGRGERFHMIVEAPIGGDWLRVAAVDIVAPER